jgi:hypothetical protein
LADKKKIFLRRISEMQYGFMISRSGQFLNIFFDQINVTECRSEILQTYVYRGINEFKKGYQHRSNLIKDENCHPLANSDKFWNI